MCIPSIFPFCDFSDDFQVIFDLVDLLDLFVNFFLDMLDLVVMNIWLKSCSNPLFFEEVICIRDFSFVPPLSPFFFLCS